MNCVMHKCTMVKLGNQNRNPRLFDDWGNEKHIKYVKTRILYEIRGKFAKVGEIIIFPEIGGKYTETDKIGGTLND